MQSLQVTDGSQGSATLLERVNFFNRQLLTANDMTTECDYFRQKLRRHDRFMHGWGVVCGLAVTAAPVAGTAWRVEIGPGYALGPYGDEIFVGEAVYFDLAACLSGSATNPCEPNILIPGGGGTSTTAYLAIQYAECLARPVDRKLQPAPEVFCRYFVYAQREEDIVLAALVRKTETIRTQLGSAGQVIEQRIADRLNASGIERGRAAALAEAIDAGSRIPDVAATTIPANILGSATASRSSVSGNCHRNQRHPRRYAKWCRAERYRLVRRAPSTLGLALSQCRAAICARVSPTRLSPLLSG